METTLTQTAHPVTGPEKPKHRRFSTEYKLRILNEADRCTKPGHLGLLRRREGLYSSHLAAWRRWRRVYLPSGAPHQMPVIATGMKPRPPRMPDPPHWRQDRPECQKLTICGR